MDKFLKKLRHTRHFTFMYMSVWKVACMFVTLLTVTYIEQGSVDSLFDLFEASFSRRYIPINEVSNAIISSHSVIFHKVLIAHILLFQIHINWLRLCLVYGRHILPNCRPNK
jgi:hypothetical protein